VTRDNKNFYYNLILIMITTHDFLELQYISPMSTYPFYDNNKYFLIISNIQNKSEIFIYTIELSNINNITDNIRGYRIAKSIQINKKTSSPYYLLRLFEYSGNNITLLFSQKINLNDIETNNKNTILLQMPKINNTIIKSDFKNYTSFLSEQFFNYEIYDASQTCILFFTKSNKPTINPIINPTTIKFTDDYIYNQYFDSIIKESNSSLIKYNKNEIIRSNKIGLYNNNIIVSPTDGIYKIHITSNSTKISCKKRQHDFSVINCPYEGKIIKITEINNTTTLLFENDYFMPPSVKEREYISVFLGHPIFESRISPEFLNIQPKIKLYFSIIITSNDLQLNHKIKENMWINQVEEIGNLESGDISIVFNRKVHSTNNIQYYSKLGMFSYIKNKDTIGLIL
jgi:hypothetical protein